MDSRKSIQAYCRLALGAVSVLVLTAMMATAAGMQCLAKDTVLEFGMFTGSNWDVANANSFTIIDEAIEKFEADHPGVTVHYYSGIRKDDYSEWLSRKFLSGDQPDVFMVLSEDFNQFSALGLLEDLDTHIEKDPEFDTDSYFSTALRSGEYGEHQYALPYETMPKLMFVNKTLLDKEGIAMPDEDWTWEEFYSICSQVTGDENGDGLPDRFGVYNYSWLDAAYANGAAIFSDDGKACFLTDERVNEAVSFIRRLNNLESGRSVTQDDYNNGHVAFMPLTFAEYRTYKTYPYKIKKYASFQWDCITMPAGESGGNISQVDSLLLGMSVNSKHKELAWEFLKLLTYDEDIQTEIFRYSQGASVLKAVTNSRQMEEILQEDMDEGDTVISGSLLASVIENGYTEPQFRKHDSAMSLADNEIRQIAASDSSLDTALKIVQIEVENYLAS